MSEASAFLVPIHRGEYSTFHESGILTIYAINSQHSAKTEYLTIEQNVECHAARAVECSLRSR
jgi:hypothetical protein